MSDAQLDWLYTHCMFTVYPSVYEGWGLPVAESLAYGKLCISSNTSSMPEIAGDLIEYFSPYDPAACLALLEKYLDPEVRQHKEAEIKKNYAPRSWDATFQQIESIIIGD
jgi:glycosyltransferase involved in cell wall biosynthesis